MYVHTVLPRYFSSFGEKDGARLWIDRSMKSATKISRNFFFFSCFVLFLIFRHLSLPTSSHLEITRISLLLLRSAGGGKVGRGGAREHLFLNVMICLFKLYLEKPLLIFIKENFLRLFKINSLSVVLLCMYCTYKYSYNTRVQIYAKKRKRGKSAIHIHY